MLVRHAVREQFLPADCMDALCVRACVGVCVEVECRLLESEVIAYLGMVEAVREAELLVLCCV